MIDADRAEPYYPGNSECLISLVMPHDEFVARFGPAHRQMDERDNEPGPCEFWAYRFRCGLSVLLVYHFSRPRSPACFVYADRPEIDHVLEHLQAADCVEWRLDHAHRDVFRERHREPVARTCPLASTVESGPRSQPAGTQSAHPLPDTSNLEAEFVAFVAQLRQDAVATEFRGCTPEEVLHLERVYDCRVPITYRLYLLTMGHAAGRLFSHDHYAVTYEHVLQLGQQLREGLAEVGAPSAPEFHLPANALVILGRLGEQYEYIVCDDPDDSPVFYVNTYDRVASRAHASVLGWLRDIYAEAVEAIRDGYYDRYPNGTRP
ncbi:MAG: hypothetical protein K8T90_04330 [Planctomycetes bacterium]|nr:hypothetical protein [Planctomycetota bacterium]